MKLKKNHFSLSGSEERAFVLLSIEALLPALKRDEKIVSLAPLSSSLGLDK